MRKNSFIDGAIISTLCLVLCKILGLIYVIPFYKIIGSQGGALYSYAYSIYAVFLNLSTVGIPSAIAKIISEYDTLHYYESKEKAFKIASKLLNYIGIISFLIMFAFANTIAEHIIGGVEGGNSVSDVATAIRVVSTALLVVPRLSILKGYFQGNKYITQPSISTIIEQLVRVSIIIFGSFITVKVFHLPVEYAVFIATFGATIGALSAFIYLKAKHKKVFDIDKNNKEEVTGVINQSISSDEAHISIKALIKKIIVYAIPFVIISILQSAYNVIDTFTVVKTLSSIGYTTSVAETTIGVMSTWASKLNMIVVSMAIGLTASLIPSVVSSYTKGDFKDINKTLNLSFKMLIFIMTPMALGMSFLAEPIWHVFYGVDTLSSSIFRFYILQVIAYGLFSTSITITQSMNQTKITVGALITSFLLKFILNVPMMHFVKMIGIESYYAPTIVDAISQILALTGVLIALKKKYKFSYRELIPFVLKVLLGVSSMLIVLFLLKYIYFSNVTTLSALITIIVYTIVGAIIYFVVINSFGLLNEIFGDDYKDKLLRKLKIRKE